MSALGPRPLVGTLAFGLVVACGVPQVSERPVELVISNVGIVDLEGAGPPLRASIVVQAGVIEEVVAAAEPAPRAVLEFDASGLFAIPGLWDLHVHLYHAGMSSLPVFLAQGVTSVRDMGGELEHLLSLRSEVDRGVRLGPRLAIAGPMLESPDFMASARERGVPERQLQHHVEIAGVAEAERKVAELAAAGVDFIKGRYYASEDVYRAIGRSARSVGLRFVGHPLWSLDPQQALEAGQSGFEHGFYPWPLADLEPKERRELVEALRKSGAALVPTLVGWEPRAMPLDRVRAIVDDDEGRLDSRRRYVGSELLENWEQSVSEWEAEGAPDLQAWREVLDRHAREIGELHRAGVLVLAGTDVAGPLVYPGFGLHDELRLLVEKAGLAPREALQAATIGAAEFMGRGHELGRLERGMLADLVLLRSDPAGDIGALSEVEAVVTQGRLLTRDRLDDLLEEAAARSDRR